jgi:hypothetical protein
VHNSSQSYATSWAGRFATKWNNGAIRCDRFARVRNSIRIARLLSTALTTNLLCARANGAKRHSANEHGNRVRSLVAQFSPWPEQRLPPHRHATRRQIAVSTELPADRHIPVQRPILLARLMPKRGSEHRINRRNRSDRRLRPQPPPVGRVQFPRGHHPSSTSAPIDTRPAEFHTRAYCLGWPRSRTSGLDYSQNSLRRSGERLGGGSHLTKLRTGPGDPSSPAITSAPGSALTSNHAMAP